MEKENSCIAYVKNLSKQTFSSTINLQVDKQADIKTILNISCYVFDEKIETANGKAVVSGKIGTNVLYVDTDNITNTLTETQPFSENLIDSSITSDCHIVLNNLYTSCQIETENTNKVNCNISFTPTMYVNLAFKSLENDNEKIVTKKSNIVSSEISNKINTNFNYSSILETKDEISKVLSSHSVFKPTNITAQNGFAIVEGKLTSKIIYEYVENEETKIKHLDDNFAIKTDVEIENLTENDLLDLNFSINKAKEDISTEIEDGNSVITINNLIMVKGIAFKQVELDLVEDLYSVSNELTISKCSRDLICENKTNFVEENIYGEISLNKTETAIDEVICNSNETVEITNTYIKDNFVYFEGIINSTLIYIDEEKTIKNKQLELPFVINTKIESNTLPANTIETSAITTKIKVRRGTIIELEYNLNAVIYTFNSCNKEIVDNIQLGTALDFSKYDYQIYIAKPNETMWDLCKRIKCYPDDINKYNKNLPLNFTGGEKIIIKR